jgi:hypothetical protein
MCDYEVLKLHEVLLSAARTPKIILQRTEEMFLLFRKAW